MLGIIAHNLRSIIVVFTIGLGLLVTKYIQDKSSSVNHVELDFTYSDDDIIEIKNSEGKLLKFVILDIVEHNGNSFVLVESLDAINDSLNNPDSEADTSEILVMKLVGEELEAATDLEIIEIGKHLTSPDYKPSV